MKILMALLVTSFSFAAIAGDIDNSDPGKTTVKRSACLAGDGEVTDNDSRYYICEGGKYDGYITQGPVTNCAEKVDAASALAVNADSEYVLAAKAALDACSERAKAHKFTYLPQTLKSAEKACEAANDTETSKAVCQVAAAEFSRTVMGK